MDYNSHRFASASEEMTLTINEIANNTLKAREISEKTVLGSKDITDKI